MLDDGGARIAALEAEVARLTALIPTDPKHDDCVVVLRSGFQALGDAYKQARDGIDAARQAQAQAEGKLAAILDKLTGTTNIKIERPEEYVVELYEQLAQVEADLERQGQQRAEDVQQMLRLQARAEQAERERDQLTKAFADADVQVKRLIAARDQAARDAHGAERRAQALAAALDQLYQILGPVAPEWTTVGAAEGMHAEIQAALAILDAARGAGAA